MSDIPSNAGANRPKIIVLDDDPTGSQTVHSCPLLLRWDVESLIAGLLDPSPLVFILTNTRSRPATEAEQVTRAVCRNLQQALRQAQIQTYLLISRSDSTLRGHYPLETDAIAQELGPFDAHFLVPAFLEGGRITIDGTHYIQANGHRTPVHKTEFARDPVFGFSHSDLPHYVAEKTQGKIAAEQVQGIRLKALRPQTGQPGEGRKLLRSQLQQLQHNTCVAVDAEHQSDLDTFAAAVLEAAAQGKRFLFRSAASLLTSLANLPPQPVRPEAMAQYVRSHRPGLVLVGSYVQKTTQQLAALLKLDDVLGIELNVARLQAHPDQADALRQAISEQIQQCCDRNLTPVVYTSRAVLSFQSSDEQLAFGRNISALLVAIVQRLPADIGFLISKGGITSNDTLSQALALGQVRLLGQIIPGVCIVKTEPEHAQFPDLPMVLFPGNVGEEESLAIAYRRLRPVQPR